MSEHLSSSESEVYCNLSDDLSKRIFSVRKAYAESVTADFPAVFKGRPIKDISELVDKLQKNSFVCYGAGGGCQKLLNLLARSDALHNCKAIFDSNPAEHGKIIEGIGVTSFQQKLADSADFILITPYYYSSNDSIKKMTARKNRRMRTVLSFI